MLENYKPYKITLSEFWESQDKLSIKYENDKQGESIYNLMIDRGFCCKVRCKGISDRFEEVNPDEPIKKVASIVNDIKRTLKANKDLVADFIIEFQELIPKIKQNKPKSIN